MLTYSLLYATQVISSTLKHAGALITAEDMEPAGYADKLFYDLKFSKATQTAKVSDCTIYSLRENDMNCEFFAYRE